MSFSGSLRRLLLSVWLLTFVSVQAFAAEHVYDHKKHLAGEICGLCLNLAQLDDLLPAEVQPAEPHAVQPALLRVAPTLLCQRCPLFAPARAPPALR